MEQEDKKAEEIKGEEKQMKVKEGEKEPEDKTVMAEVVGIAGGLVQVVEAIT